MLNLERPAWEVDPWLSSGNLDLTLIVAALNRHEGMERFQVRFLNCDSNAQLHG